MSKREYGFGRYGADSGAFPGDVQFSPKPYDSTAVYIGRFQPPHAAHVGSVIHALGRAERVLVLVGSANLARSAKNPWSALERTVMFRAALREAGADWRRVEFSPLPDRFDAERWAADVRKAAAEVFGAATLPALVGFEKDASSAYLRWFPGWPRLVVPETPGLSATAVRQAYFTGGPLPGQVPSSVQNVLISFRLTPAFRRLRLEWEALEGTRSQIAASLPLHEQRYLHAESGQVWLHTRHGPIGEGLWELPGGYIDTAPAGSDAVFDHPARALLAPTVAYVQRVAPPESLAAHPVSLAYAMSRPCRFFEDHHVILSKLLS